MTVRTKIEPIDDWIAITVDETLSPEARSKAVASFAGQRLKEAQDVNQRVLGRIPPHETFVDGRKGGRLADVDSDHGVIVFEFELVADVLSWIGKELVARSPVTSGRYRRSHTLFADGKEIFIGENIPPAREYVFQNTQPYARKIEVGKTKAGRAFVIQVEPRIYERVGKDAKARFGNVVKIGFGFRAILGGDTSLEQWAVKSRGRRGSARAVAEWKRRQPAIFVWTD